MTPSDPTDQPAAPGSHQAPSSIPDVSTAGTPTQDGARPAAAAASERRRIRAATLLFSVATAVSRVAGLLREMVVASLIGATTLASAYTIANQIPNLLRSLVADSALSAAFVPVFTELRENGEQERAWRVASAMCTVIVAILGPVTVLAMVGAPWIVRPFVDGTFTEHDIQVAIGLTRLLLPIVVILSLSGVVVGILNAHDRFGAAAFAPVAWNAVIVGGLLVLASTGSDEHQVWIYAAVTLAGTVVQAVLPTPWLRGLGGRLDLRATWRDPKVREIFVLMLPVTISLGLINIQQLLSSVFAANVDASALVAGLDPGAGPALLDKAFRIYMLPQGMFSVAVSTVIFPVLARMAARDDRAGFVEAVDTGLRQILVLLVPSSVFIGVFARPLTQLMYQRGAFDAAQTEGVALALVAFAIGLTFNGLSLLLIRSFFSLRQTWIPSTVSAITLVVNTALAWSTYRLHVDGAAHQLSGVFAIALATSVANIVGVALLYRLLGPRTAGLGTRRTLAVAGGTLLAAAVGVGLADAAFRLWRDHTGASFLPTLGGISIAMAIAIPVYLALGAALGVVPRGFVRQLARRGG